MFYIDLPHACYGVEVIGTVVTLAPPIAGWMVGRSIDSVVRWVVGKRGVIFPI